MRGTMLLLLVLSGCFSRDDIFMDGVFDTGMGGAPCDDGMQVVPLDEPLEDGLSPRDRMAHLLGPRSLTLTWASAEARAGETLSWELALSGEAADYQGGQDGCDPRLNAEAQLALFTEDGTLEELIPAALSLPLELGTASVSASQRVEQLSGSYRPRSVQVDSWDEVTLLWSASFVEGSPVGGLDVSAQASRLDSGTGEAQVGRLADFR